MTYQKQILGWLIIAVIIGAIICVVFVSKKDPNLQNFEDQIEKLEKEADEASGRSFNNSKFNDCGPEGQPCVPGQDKG